MCIDIVQSSCTDTSCPQARLTEEICRQGHQESALRTGRLMQAARQRPTTQLTALMLMKSCLTTAAAMMMVSHWQPCAVVLPPPLNTFKNTSLRLGGVVVRALDLCSTAREFNSQPCTAGLVLRWVTVCVWVNYLCMQPVTSSFKPSGIGKSRTSLWLGLRRGVMLPMANSPYITFITDVTVKSS